jgi:hypothetical protein
LATKVYAELSERANAAPRLLVPDKLKSGINKPSFYDPEVTVAMGPWQPTRQSASYLPGRGDPGTRVCCGCLQR